MSIYNSYKGKKILVTGHTGFKGAWMLAILYELEANVLGYALDPEIENCLYNQIDGNQKCKSIIGDIRDLNQLNQTIQDFEPDYVFHLAAQAFVLKSYKIPAETFDVNVTGTANVLESVSNLSKKCTVVVVTTDKVYKNNEWEFPYKEDDTLGGYDPYSASKACTEIVVSSFRDSFFNTDDFNNHQKTITSVRAGNVIGGGDYSENRIIPDIIRSLQKNKPIELRHPKAIRPWQHVLEPLFAYLKLGLLLNEDPIKFATPFNIGPQSDDNLTVEELVQKAIKVWGSGKYISKESTTPHEAGILKLDISLAKTYLDWHPIYSSSQAIEKTIKWYKETDKLKITLTQVKDYLNEIS